LGAIHRSRLVVEHGGVRTSFVDAEDAKAAAFNRKYDIRPRPDTPVIRQVGHFAQCSLLSNADGVCQMPMDTGDDPLVPVESNIVDEQSQVRIAQARG
jgi:hypothetical protein